MVSTTAYHPGIEKDPEQLDTDSPDPFLTTRKKEGGRKPAFHSRRKYNISLHFSKLYVFQRKRFHSNVLSSTDDRDGFSGKTTLGMKREHGEAYPKGTETVAAPATVSGE